MGEITVSTPDGDKVVIIAGDSPTEEEEQAIINTFFADQAQSTQEPEPEPEPDKPKLPTRKIDYDTGVQDMFFRKEFSKGDNEEERRARLQNLGVNPEAIQVDDKGEFLLDRDLLSDDIKSKFNITGSGLMAIDEKKGFTKYDFADFYGEARGPLIGGLTASLAATGVGAIPAAIIAGGGTALGYLFDEFQEDQEGLRRETDADLGRGALGEFLLGGTGELGGRALAAFFGRVLKGSGADSANEARAVAREVIAGGGRPTVRAANESPILGRLQAIYEGVFPNKKAAQANADFVARELSSKLKNAGISGKSVDEDELIKLLDQDIKRIYGDPESIVREANDNLTTMVNTEIDKLIKTFGDTSKPVNARQVAESINVAKRIFDEDVDVLYAQANKLLDGKRIVPMEGLVKKLEFLQESNPGFAIAESGIGKFIKKFEKTTASGQRYYDNATIAEMNGIRTALREAGFDPSLVGTQNGKFIGQMMQEIEHSFRRAKIVAREQMMKRRDKTGKPIFVPKTTTEAIEGLDLLDKANTYYGKGIQRFREGKAAKIVREFNEGNLPVESLIDSEGGLLIPNRGDVLNKFFKSVVPGGKAAIEAPRTFEEFLGRSGIDANFVNSLPEDDFLRSTLNRKFEESKRFANKVAAARGTGVEAREALRTTMASSFLEKLARENRNIYGSFNPAAMVDEINRLGSTGQVLFGNQHKQVISALQDLGTLNPRIANEEIARMAGMPIADQVTAIKALLKQQDEMANSTLLKGISRAVAERNPDQVLDLVFKKGDKYPALIKEAEQQLGADTMDMIRQSAMERILRQLPDRKTGGRQFVDDVLSGAHSTKLKSILDAYGDATVDAMFGKEVGSELRRVVERSATASNKEIKGLGALAPASLATGLGLVAYLTNPLATAVTAGGIKFGASVLRSETYLKLITRPTGVRPGKGEYDQLGRLFEMAYEIGGQSIAQQADAIPMPTPTVQSPEAEQQRREQEKPRKTDELFRPLNIGFSTAAPQVAPATAGSARQVSPLLLPDPATQALAQQLGRTTR